MPPGTVISYHSIWDTFPSQNPLEPESEGISDEADATSHLLSPSIKDPLGRLYFFDSQYSHVLPVSPTEAQATRTLWRVSLYDVALLSSILVMLVWPWILFGLVWRSKGLQFSNHLAKFVTDHPLRTSFFATLIGNIVNLFVSVIFSLAIIRFAQAKVASGEDVTVFDISLLSALKNQYWPWGLTAINLPFVRIRWLQMLWLLGCTAAFAFVPSSTTTLITPVPIGRTAPLTGTELDFSSSDAECLQWFEENMIPSTCDWTISTSKNLRYSTCLASNQMLDVLESGRGNILSLLSHNSETIALSQLGAKDGIHFLGPIRGVLPIGPNGVPAFDPLLPSPFETNPLGMTSYNYTLNQQGFASNIQCKYDSESPITFAPVPGNPLLVMSNGSCDGLINISGDDDLKTPRTNAIAFWPCVSVPTKGIQKELTYYLYLHSLPIERYSKVIGNITCVVSSIQPAIFPVTYQSGRNIFSCGNPIETQATTFPLFILRVLAGTRSAVWQAQSAEENLMAESVSTFGAKAYNLPPYDRDERYLRLYEAMLQGIIEYQTTYGRFLYSMNTTRPSACVRKVIGSVDYLVIGWFAEFKTIVALLPMTTVNLVSLITLLLAMLKGKRGGCKYDPLDAKEVLLASANVGVGQSAEWEFKVEYRRRVSNANASKLGDKELKEV